MDRACRRLQRPPYPPLRLRLLRPQRGQRVIGLRRRMLFGVNRRRGRNTLHAASLVGETPPLVLSCLELSRPCLAGLQPIASRSRLEPPAATSQSTATRPSRPHAAPTPPSTSTEAAQLLRHDPARRCGHQWRRQPGREPVPDRKMRHSLPAADQQRSSATGVPGPNT